MSDENRPSTPPPPPEGGTTGAGAPPPPPTGGTGGAGGGTGAPPPTGPTGPQNRGLMLVLSYLWVLALVPYLTEQKDPEIKWHARHGLVLLIAEVILGVVIFILSMIPGLGCIMPILSLLIWLGIIVLHVVCLVKALNGERFMVPYVSDYANQIP